MKIKDSLLPLIFATMTLSSCSEQIYNNKDFAGDLKLEGKKITILPAVVNYGGRHAERASWFDLELTEGERIHQELERYFLASRGIKKPGKYGVHLVSSSDSIKKILTSGRTFSNAQLREITGADIIVRSKLIRTRIISKIAAIALNASSKIISGIFSSKNVEVNTPLIHESEVEYMVETVDLQSGIILSSYQFDPNQSDAGKRLTLKANKAMAKKGLFYLLE